LKNKSKLIIGIFLITGLVFLCYLGVTNALGEEPPEQDDDDPGNGRGPGFWDSLPIDGTVITPSVEMALNSLI
jgi:hypothetical protein